MAVSPYDIWLQHDASGAVVLTAAVAGGRLVVTQDPEFQGEGVLFVASTSALDVRADEICLRGPIALPGCAISLVARRLTGTNDSKGRAPAISTSTPGGKSYNPEQTSKSPKAGKGKAPNADAKNEKCWPLPAGGEDRPATAGEPGDPGDPGDPGGSAHAAGAIVIVAEHVAPDLRLPLSAVGGNGGDGERGGDGGQGGDGGDGTDECKCGFMFWGNQIGQPGADNGKGGRGGPGGPGGQGGSGGDITVVVPDHAQSAFQADETAVRAGAMGRPGHGGAGGAPGKPGKAGSKMVAIGTGQGLTHATEALPGGRDLGPGDPGAVGVNLAPTAKPGKLIRASLPPHLHAAFLAPGYALLMLDEADRLFLEGTEGHQPGLIDLARGKYEWLLGKLEAFLAAPDPADVAGVGDALAQRYQHIVGQADTALRRQMTDAYALVGARLQKMRLRADIFGHSTTYVPLRSVAEHQKSLTLYSSLLARLESQLDAYATAQKDVDKSQAARQILTSQPQRREFFAALKVELVKHIQDVVVQIERGNARVEEARQRVLACERDFSAALRSQVAWENLGQLVGVVETLAFTPEEGWQQGAMAVSQTAKGFQILANTFTSLTDDLGRTWDSAALQGMLIAGTQSLDAAATSLGDAYRTSGGKVLLADPSAKMLLASREQLLKLMAPFSMSVCTAPLRDAMDALVGAVRLRNGALLEYNAGIAQYQSLTVMADKSEVEVQQAEAWLTQASAESIHDPVLSSVVHDMHRKVLFLAQGEVASLHRAYALWSVGDPGAGPTAGGHAVPQSSVEVDNASATVQSLIDKARSGRLSAQQLGSASDRRGSVVVLDRTNAPDFIAALRRTGRGQCELAPERRGTSGRSGLAGKSNIRLTEVRVWVTGLVLGDGASDEVLIRLSHTGREWITDERDRCVEFTHAIADREFRFKFSASKGLVLSSTAPVLPAALPPESAIVTGAVLTNDAGDALIGPFATWQIELGEAAGAPRGAVDCSGIEAVAFEFFGIYFPFVQPQAG